MSNVSNGVASRQPLVSLCVVALNEEDSLPSVLDDIVVQDYPHECLEVILVDSGSTDATRSLMEAFAAEAASHGFVCVRVLDNLKRFQAPGWNVAIRSSVGDVIVRVDAHASIPIDFVSANVAVLNEGEDVCGGVRPTMVAPALRSPWRSMLHAAEESAFGSSAADFRRDAEARYVDSLFHGAYRREVFKRAGVFDERLMRTEDNEMHYRIRQHGFKIRLDPRVHSTQFVRATLKDMLKQKWGNGYWIGRTLYLQPHCFKAYHFVPLVFVAGIILLALVGMFASWMPFEVCGVLYVALCVALAVKAALQSPGRNATMLALPFVFAAIHVVYGVGTLWGMAVGLFARFDSFDTSY